jgi:hypothetical protein
MGALVDGCSYLRKMVRTRDNDAVVVWICCGFRFWLVVDLEVSNGAERAYYFERLKNEKTCEKIGATRGKRLDLG